MEQFSEKFGRLSGSTKHVVRRMLAVGGNRLELLVLELGEERELFMLSVVIGLGIAAFGLLAMLALTAAVVIALRDHSPGWILGGFAAFYGIVAVVLALFLRRMMRKEEMLSATFDQLRKDHRTFEKIFS